MLLKIKNVDAMHIKEDTNPNAFEQKLGFAFWPSTTIRSVGQIWFWMNPIAQLAMHSARMMYAVFMDDNDTCIYILCRCRSKLRKHVRRNHGRPALGL